MIGKTLGHYEILESLGAGGMGEVYRARDSTLRREVAVKVLPEDLAADPHRLARLKREAQLLATLNHPNIATIHALEEQDGARFLVLELVKGDSLEQLLTSGPLPTEKALAVCRQIAAALEAAHNEGIVHRDLKPANVVVTPDGRAKVLDFGVATSVDVDADITETAQGTNLTVAGTLIGTPAYMSPEQVRGEVIDKRSDNWAFGCVLYEVLTGRSAFGRETLADILAAVIDQDPDWEALSRVGGGNVESLIRRCLQKDPQQRLRDIGDAWVEIGEAMGGATVAVEPAPSPKQGKALAAVALSVVLVAAGAIWWQTRPADESSLEVAAIADGEATKLAVLPFSNLRSDPETDFLGYALADQVIGSLVYVQELTVRPSSSVRKYQHGEYELDEVRDELAVNFVLAGNYLRQGDEMRLTVELIDLETEETVWREPIEVPYEDVFEMQDLVSARLLARLEISFSEAERTRMHADVSESSLAYEYFLRSLSYLEDAEGNRLAVDMLRQSTDLEPTYAPAWDALGRRAQVAAYWELGGEEVFNQASGFFLKALEINPELFSALAHMSMLYTDSGETDLAMESAQRMLEINPKSAVAHFAYGYVLRYAGMTEESAAAMDAALEIDPTNPMFRSAAYAYVHAGRYDDAIEAFYLGTPNLALAWEGEIAIRRGDAEEARAKLAEAIAMDPEDITGLWATGVLSALDGDYARGLEAARKWEEADLVDGEGWFYLAGVYCINGDIDKCIALLDKAVDGGAFQPAHFLECRFLEPVRGTPEFDAVLEKARAKHEAFRAKFF